MKALGMTVPCTCLTAALAALAPGRKRTLKKVPLACFVGRGVDPGGIDVPFGITAGAPFAVAFTNIRVVAGAAADADALDCGAVAHWSTRSSRYSGGCR